MIYNLKIEMDYDRQLSYIRHLYGYDRLRSITVKNLGQETARDLKLKLSSAPELTESWIRYIEEVPAGGQMVIEDPGLIIDGEALLSYNETLDGHLIAEIMTADEKSEPVCKEAFPLTILPYDLWSSVNHPELLGVFVTPNDRRVLDILARAGERYGMAFSGYDNPGGKKDVLKMMKAIFEIIQEEKITYVYPPANWDRGQRVRMPGFTLANKMGCCIDMAVLYAACLEAASLNAFVMILRGHAVAGCWLKDECFPEIIIHDRETVEKRNLNALGDLAIVECTLMDNYAFGTPFESALKASEGLFASFEYVIDIRRARQGDIRPMPLKEIHGGFGYEEDAESAAGSQALTSEADDAAEEIEASEFLEDTPQAEMTKLVYWERKILDPSLRNPMLNMSLTAKNLPLMGRLQAMCDLTAGLVEGRSYRLLGAPEELSGLPELKDADAQAELMYQRQSQTADDLAAGRLRVLMTQGQTLSALKSLYRTSRTITEESGANVLYLAAGFLKWRTDDKDRARLAPLVMIPVTLERLTDRTDYRLSLRDDEWQMNTTLFEMLKDRFGIRIGGTDSVPMEEGLPAYRKLLNTLMLEIREQPGWMVLDRMYLGLFSFGQYMLWRDLHEYGSLFAKHPIVGSLVEGCLQQAPEKIFMTPGQLDREIRPSDLIFPVSADGTQMAAVQAAAAGHSFVMHGPPGTGKSQTITNMIANALYQGKSVLFLARKMPALEVVQTRLDEIGLGPFCLELFADKTSRRHLLDQLEETLSLGRKAHDRLYENASGELMEKRQKLRHLIDALHAPRKCGLSLYTLMGMMSDYREAKEAIHFDGLTLRTVTEADLAAWKRQLKALEKLLERLPDPGSHPLKDIRKGSFLPEEKRDLAETLSGWQDLMKALSEAVAAMQARARVTPRKEVPLREYVVAADILARAPRYPKALAELLDAGYDFEELAEGYDMLEGAGAIIRQVDEAYDPRVLRQDLDKWENACRKAGSGRGLMGRVRRSCLRQLQAYARDKDAVDDDNIEEVLAWLAGRKRDLEALKDLTPAAAALKKHLPDVDWPAWQAAHEGARRSLDRLDHLYVDEEAYQVLSACLRARISGEEDEEAGRIYGAVRPVYEAAKAAAEKILVLTGYEYEGRLSDLMLSEAFAETVARWQDHFHELDVWCSCRKELEAAEIMGLSPVTEAIEAGLSAGDLIPAFYRSFSSAYVREIIRSDAHLYAFNGLSYDNLADKYRALAKEFEKMSRAEVLARLTDRLPDYSEGSDSKDFTALNKAVMGGGSKLTVRQLLTMMPEAVLKLKPCMLMSPASVAQYLDAGFPKFDLVIIDEASQMPTCEAVGALARGKACVIAGDEMQLPPTSFFEKKQESEDLLLDDLESILDDALALNMPQCYLGWHYRSAHESLITFSNARYYDGRLHSFPSVDHRTPAVSFVNVGGTYDRAGSRTNPAEAEAVTLEMRQRILENPDLSIGVITFNMQQRSLIEDRWEAMLSSDPALAEAVRAAEKKTPVFIKNLENVQGDERDIILFSIGFGPDSYGTMSMNFGPVNQSGGHRRLNVAVTRARQKMKVFASFEPEAIRVSAQSARGLKDLKDFLAYARDGRTALPELSAAPDTGRMADSMAKALREKGLEADINIGASLFKIDLAVRHPKMPDKYLLAVIFGDDAAAFGDVVRDSMILKASVLERMGWQVMRLWLLDWWQNPEAQVSRVAETVRRLLEEEES